MGERSFDIYSRLLRERIIMISGPIDDISASIITTQLLFLESEAPQKPLYMYINSPGGNVVAGLAIYDTMQYIHPAVHTIATGQAGSMAALLLCGGDVRMALPHAEILLHQPLGGTTQGMASNIAIQSQELIRQRSVLNELYAKHTGQSIETIEKVMDRNTYMDCTAAMEFGLIDSILQKRELPSSSSAAAPTTSSSTSTSQNDNDNKES